MSGADTLQPRAFSALDAARLLPVPAPDANKYTRGCLLVVGGCGAYRGAPVMASLAAQRCGAGYVRLATAPAAAQSAQSRLLSATVASLPANSAGYLCADALPQLEELAGKANAVLVGPGLGCVPDTLELLWAMLESPVLAPLPWLLDADALNIASADVERLARLRAGRATVITPHEGEAACLLGHKVQERVPDALELSRACNAAVVLKGPRTLIANAAASPVAALGSTVSSDAASPALFCIESGGAELSKAGTGDVLAGMIAALLAQGLEPVDAACLGVYLHGTSGALAARAQSVVSALPEDVIDKIGCAVLALQGQSPALAAAQEDATRRAQLLTRQ